MNEQDVGGVSGWPPRPGQQQGPSGTRSFPICGMWAVSLPERTLTWASDLEAMLPTERLDGTLASWCELLHPEDHPAVVRYLERAASDGAPFSAEFRALSPNGSWSRQRLNCHAMRDKSGQLQGLVGLLECPAQLKTADATSVSYDAILEMVATGEELPPTLAAICRLMESQIPGFRCSILLLDANTNRLRFGAGPSLPDAYNNQVNGVPIGPNVGSCGTAAHRKQTVVVCDIATDPLWEKFTHLTLPHGLRSCISVPIFGSGKIPGVGKDTVIGTFAFYGSEPLSSNWNSERADNGLLLDSTEKIDALLAAGEVSLYLPIVETTHLAQVAIERQRAEEALREGEARFRNVLDSSPVAVLLRDNDSRFVFVNKTATDTLSPCKQDWVGKRPDEITGIYSCFLDDLQPHLGEASNASPTRNRLTWRRSDGRERTVLAARFPLLTAEGTPYARCDIFTEISELVELQQELYHLWSSAPEPLCVIGLNGNFLQINPAWLRLLGWNEVDLIGKPWTELVHPEDREHSEQALQRLARFDSVEHFENRYRRIDGSYLWFGWDTISRVAHRTIYGFVRNITQEKELTSQVRQAQKMEAVGQLASGIAHDFNNLLTVISSYSVLMADLIPGEHPGREMLSEIQAAALRATELTSQLLAFSRKARVIPMVLDPRERIGSSLKMLARLIGENIRLRTEFSSSSSVRIDPGLFEQMLMNLVVNARDAMPGGGLLTIATEEFELPQEQQTESGPVGPGQFLRLAVSDTGEGISSSVRSRIFEPFFTTKDVGRGTGLGLATVYGITQQAGGGIEVQSQEGVGTTITILLPAVAPAPREEAKSQPASSPRGHETVLLAEDEPGVRRVAQRLLEAQGYRVLTAEHGVEALQVEEHHDGPIHLLLSDVVMPEMGGRLLAEEMRRRRPEIRVVMMSGYTDDEQLRSGLGSPLLQKPFAAGELARQVRLVLDGPPQNPS